MTFVRATSLALWLSMSIVTVSAQAPEPTPVTSGEFVSVGNAQVRGRRFDEAIQSFSSAIAANPNSLDAYYARAKAYREKNNFDLALADYSKAIQLNARHTQSFLGRGDVHTLKGNADPAIADYTQAISLGIKEPIEVTQTYTSRANVYSAQNRNDLALADYAQAIAAGTGGDAFATFVVPAAYVGRARLHLQVGNSAAAITDLQAALKLDATYQDAKDELAKAQAPRPAPAPGAATPSTADDFFRLGQAQSTQRNLDGAIQSYTECLRLQPNTPACLSLRGALYILKGDMLRGNIDYAAALKLAPTLPAIFTTKAIALNAIGWKADAIDELRKLLKLDPNNARAKQLMQEYGGQP